MFLGAYVDSKLKGLDGILSIMLMVIYSILTTLILGSSSSLTDIFENCVFAICNIVFLVVILLITKVRKQDLRTVGVVSKYIYYIIFVLYICIFCYINLIIKNNYVVFLNLLLMVCLQELLFRGYAFIRVEELIGNKFISYFICGIFNGIFCFNVYKNIYNGINIGILILFSLLIGILMQIIYGLIYKKYSNIYFLIMIHSILVLLQISTI